MKRFTNNFAFIAIVLCLVCRFAPCASAQNLTLRIVCYNIEDDITNKTYHIEPTAPLPGLIYPYAGGSSTNGSITNGGVLEGIGEEILSDGVARPIDILALEETTSNPQTIAPIVTALNTFYGQYNPLATNSYAMSTYQATESGGDLQDGNGPNALVYNTKTVQLLASVPVDPPGGSGQLGTSSGELREVMRYEFAPAGQTPTAATEFYIYVSHYKSGGTSTDKTEREGEAVIIRNNETSLPSNARVIYVGDYNVGSNNEASYQTIASATSPTGILQGQGIDPFATNPAVFIDWTLNSLLSVKSEEDYSLHFRDDFQMSTTNIYFAQPGGLALVQGTYHSFANNGSVSYENSVDGGANTALNTDLAPGSHITASQLYLDLIGASDHLPVVADYTIPVVQPAAAFSATSSNATAPPLIVTFTDASSGIVTNWFWDFGDGVTSNTVSTLGVTHTYTNPGVYTVSETVTGYGGTNTSTQTNLITILTAYQAWQLQYFGSTTSPQSQTNADADGTGQNNLFKFVAGLNPTNPASVFVFQIAEAPTNPAQVNLSFNPAVAGRTYTLQYNTNLLNPWTPLTTTANPPVTNGTQITITDTNAGQSQEFYQIQISNP